MDTTQLQNHAATKRLKQKDSAVGKWARRVVLVLVSILTVYPLVWMLSNSFKTASTIIHSPLNLVPEIYNFSNFGKALSMAPFDLYLFNSVFTAVVIVAIQLVFSALLAYGLTFYTFPSKKLLFGAIIVTYMLPPAATYVPAYVILAKMQLLDTLSGIIISNLASVFTIFLMVQTFSGIPKELLEAAKLEGATDTQVLFKVVIPFAKSTMLTAGLINFVGMYNNYMWPSLITTSQSKMLLSVGLNTFFTSRGNFAENLPGLMAANSMAVIPLLVLFVVLQKWFIKGISNSGIKG
ncbi:carbohydrate ABC transporter permease [Peptoniphilus equinus]|uniref:Carbohydrate ABC transporter permease n=1 Tax=Peptoniphilus equinus TaxID=3016343 RepID=A0ABY7QSQ9_9FIRM|nr:carbohydrate ABC transporter permease [Peptoniphilus equinus]WBW49809.1 carbohydrate ABC transporter permease [Peptoniphilus equinus]